ncbi:MAG: helix-turn-helix domain-containing protein [Anaerolineales bacterium]|nr:helix-turn-helix domain-containing protein [Anaerolineales bacterium]
MNEAVYIRPQRLLRAIEVAEILSISRAFAYRLMQQGKIPTVCIAGARRVRPEDLSRYINKSLSIGDQN